MTATETLSPRSRLVNTTLSLIDRQGYCATGLNQIIAESETPKGSLYHYFPRGKEQLVEEAIRTTGDTSAHWIKERFSETTAMPQAFASLIVLLADHVEALGCCGGGPVAAVALEVAASNEPLRRACAETYTRWRNLFTDKLASSGFSQERSQSIALFVQSAIEGAILLSRAEGNAKPLRTLASEIERFLAQEESRVRADSPESIIL